VTWFWHVCRGGGRSFTDVTTAAHGPAGNVAFGHAGDSLYVGYPERFREINVGLAEAGQDAEIVTEYCGEVDSSGRPAGWQALALAEDTTAGLRQSGRLSFDPPRGWRPASVNNSPRLFFVRLRSRAAAHPPVAAALLGRDFVNARGTTAGVVPVFDRDADRNGDGYLDDTEYARRGRGKDARFDYESRMVTEGYGQMRFLTNPSADVFAEWAAGYQKRFLDGQPSAAGLFMDNSSGRLFLKADAVREPTGDYAQRYGALLAAVSRAVAPRWVLANTEGGDTAADAVVARNPAYLEEFALKPLAQNWQSFEALSDRIQRRRRLTTPPPLAVIDSHPQGGDATDPRTQLATLAAYYLLADPDSTCVMFFGGYGPATSWRRHWVPAAARDIGRPVARMTRFAGGADPADFGLQYRVYARSYEKALVLYRPLSCGAGGPGNGSLGTEAATRHELGREYRALDAGGAIGPAVSSVTLRNGEGAILLRAEP
jgi:hypothetical protein